MLGDVWWHLCGSLCLIASLFLCFKQKTAYEMRISDWSSDVCSSDLSAIRPKAIDGCIIIVAAAPPAGAPLRRDGLANRRPRSRSALAAKAKARCYFFASFSSVGQTASSSLGSDEIGRAHV